MAAGAVAVAGLFEPEVVAKPGFRDLALEAFLMGDSSQSCVKSVFHLEANQATTFNFLEWSAQPAISGPC